MSNHITANVEFYYKGEKITASIEIDVDHYMQTAGLRLIFLSIPFYFTYMIIGFKVLHDFDIFSNADSSWFVWNLALTILFIPLTLWLVKILNYKTRTKWVQKLIVDNGGKQIRSAIQFLSEIEEFEKNGKTNH